MDSRAHRPLAWVLIGGLIVRLALLVAVANVTVLTGDERDYVQLADSLNAGQGFAYPNGRLTSMRPPLYPAVVAALWRVAGTSSLQVVRAAQIVVELGTVVVLFLLARELFGRKVALIAAAAWCFYPSYLFAGIVILTEVLFTFLLLLACLCAVLAFRRPGRAVGWAFAAGASIGLAALTRSVVWPLPLALAPALAAITPLPTGGRVKVAVAVAIGYAVFVAPWAVRNTRIQMTPVVVDTMGGLNLRMGNYEFTPEDRMWDAVSLPPELAWSHALGVEHADAAQWTDGQRDKWASRRAIQYMTAHPATTIRRAALKFADFWGLEREYVAGLRSGKYPAPVWFAVGSSTAVLLAYAAAMVLGCVGLFNSNVEDWRMHVVPLLALVWICAIHTVVFGHSRYHLPVMPIVLIYAAAAIHERLWRRWSPATWRGFATATTIVIFAVVWSREVLFRDPERIRQLLARAGL